MLVPEPAVLLLRPESRVASLRAALGDRHIQTHCLPLQQIIPLKTVSPADTTHYDGVIFTSANAVAHAPRLPLAQSTCLALGPATAEAIQQRYADQHVEHPGQTDSEGLLALPVFQSVTGQSWLVVTGEGGRGLIASQLTRRGARVDVLETYRRAPLDPAPGGLQAGLEACQLIVTFNGESLSRLLDLCQGTLHNLLRTRQLVVPSARVVKMTEHQGFRYPPVVLSEMSDTGILAAILTCLGDGKDQARTKET